MHKVNPHTKLCFSVIVLCLLNIVTVITLLSNAANADSTSSASSTASITVPEACTMTSTTNTPHTATLSPNTYSGASGSEYANGIGKTTLTATCNDDNGFAIYAIGYTGNSYDSENHNKLVGSNTNGTIATKAYQSGDTVSNWSMKLTKVTNTSESYNPENLTITNSYNDWNVIPATYTKVAQYKASTGSSTTDTTLGAKVETTYAAYIASNQPADTYIGQVKYTMVHPYDDTPLQPQPATAGCINYFPNGNNVEGTMGCQSRDNNNNNISDGASVTLLASNFSRQGYGFAGWSNKFDYATNTDQDLKFYGPQESIIVPTGTVANGLSLYAVWIKSEGSLQDQAKTTSICNSLTTAPTDGTANLDSISALTDQRDNDTYAIAKLADGNCWMIENLRLDNTANHNTDGTLAQGYGTGTTYGSFKGLADTESIGFSDNYSANSLYSNNGDNDTINIGTSGNPAYRMPRYNSLNKTSRAINPTSNSFVSDNTTGGMYSYGNYYTWHAVMANTFYYNGPTATDTNGKTSETVNTSLCPTGWKLPRGGDKDKEATNDFWSLIVAGINHNINPANYDTNTAPYYTGSSESYSISNATRAFPNNIIYAGYFLGSSASYRGSYGNYWTSTVRSNNTSRYLYLSNTFLHPGTNSSYKHHGFTVRCIISSQL